MPLMSEEPMQEIHEKRHRPKTAKERLHIYAQLHKIPVEPPCDACPWRLYPDRVQGCDNCGCGYMAIYLAVKYYQQAKGYWPYKGIETLIARALIDDASGLLNRILKANEEKDIDTE